MTDKPGSRQPSETPPSDGGWYVPGGAGQKPTLDDETPEIPLPTNETPEQAGGWYVPPEVKTRAPDSTKIATPAPESITQPVQAITAIDSSGNEGDDDEEYDYSKYVPGVGFAGESPVTSADMTANTDGTQTADLGVTSPTTGIMQPTGIQPPISEPIATPVASLQPSVVGGLRFERIGSETPLISTDSGAGSSILGASGTSFSPATPPPSTLQDKYTNVESEVQILRRKYKVGNMTADELRAALRKLMVLDDTGNWWMIGMESDRWYKYDGVSWLQAEPPGHAATPPTLTADMPASGFGAGASFTPSQPIPPMSGDPQLPQQVSLRDMDATLVGKAAPYLDNTLKSRGITEPLPDAGATVTSASFGGTNNEAFIESPAPSIPLQPNYGDQPADLASARPQLTSVLVRLAVVSLVLVLGCSLLGVLGAIGYYYSVVNQYAASIDALAQNVQGQSQTLRIFDAGGGVIAEVSDPNAGKRTLVTLDKVSPYLIHATVATEDQRFFETPGFDVIGIVRAVLQNVSAGGTVSGASSITQQLARALVFDPSEVAAGNQTTRKIVEVFVASEISRRYSKNQILEMYLNQIPYGNFSNGIEAAAQSYFGKPAKDLNLAESALLAGLPQAPSAYNPVTNREAAFRRMRDVLRLQVQVNCLGLQSVSTVGKDFCVNQGTVDQDVVNRANVEAHVYTAPTNTYKYPHFVNYVIGELEARYGAQNLYKLGYNVFTTIDPNIQNTAEQAIRSQVAALSNNRVYNGAVFAVNPTTGAILSMVGSVDYNNKTKEVAGQYNVVLASRQPGSSIKPVVYATALERNPTTGAFLTPASILWDVQTNFNGYIPNNYDNRFRGPVAVRTALGSSYNIPAVRTLEFVGLDRFKDMAARLGLTFPLTQPEAAGLSTALGATEVRMYDLVRAYAAFANNGKRLDNFTAISKITKTVSGVDQVVFDASLAPPTTTQAVDPAVAFLITNILADNDARLPAFGANSVLRLADGRPAAVKTGTTNEFKDNWTVGYTPEIVVGTWVGNSDGTPMFNVSGIQGAAPIWNQVITAATRGKQIGTFPTPNGIAQADVCGDYGVVLDEAIANNCPTAARRRELVIAANPPPPSSNVIRLLDIDRFSGLVANEFCPDFRAQKTFLIGIDNFIAEWLNKTAAGQQWARTHGLETPITLPPTTACDANTGRPRVGIEVPTVNQTISGLYQIFGYVDVPDFASYQLQIAQPNNPSIMINIGDVTGVPRPTAGSFLGSWDTTRTADGTYLLSVKFFNRKGQSAERTIQVIVNNANPPLGSANSNTAPGGGLAVPTSPGGVATLIPFTATPFGPPPTKPLFPPTPTR